MNIFLIIAAVVFCITFFLLFRRIKPKTNCRKNDLNVLKEIVKDLPEKYCKAGRRRIMAGEYSRRKENWTVYSYRSVCQHTGRTVLL